MRKADFIIIAAAAIVFAAGSFFQSGGERISVYVDGELYKTVPFGKPTEIVIATKYGNNTVKVEKDGVRVIDADCPDRLCERMAAKKSGQSVICLPHRLSVVIEGKKETDVII